MTATLEELCEAAEGTDDTPDKQIKQTLPDTLPKEVLSLKKAYKGSLSHRFASFTCNRVNQLVVPCTLTAAAKRRRRCRSVFARES